MGPKLSIWMAVQNDTQNDTQTIPSWPISAILAPVGRLGAGEYVKLSTFLRLLPCRRPGPARASPELKHRAEAQTEGPGPGPSQTQRNLPALSHPPHPVGTVLVTLGFAFLSLVLLPSPLPAPTPSGHARARESERERGTKRSRVLPERLTRRRSQLFCRCCSLVSPMPATLFVLLLSSRLLPQKYEKR